MLMKIMGLLALVGLMTGCSSGTSGNFEVVVKNQTTESLSASLVKMNGKMEPAFATPAQIFMEAPELAGRSWGTLIKPGETATLGPVEMSLEQGSYPVIRVYEGNKTISELVAVGTHDPDTCSMMLPIGKSAFVMVKKKGKLTATQGMEP